MSNNILAADLAQQRRLDTAMRNPRVKRNKEPQTPLGFARDIIAVISSMLEDNQTSDHDSAVLKSMIRMVQGINARALEGDAATLKDEEIYSDLKEVIVTQMQLESTTCRALAKGVCPLSSRLTVIFDEDRGDHLIHAGPIARVMANIAFLKIDMDLNKSPLKKDQKSEISKIFNFFAFRIEVFERSCNTDDSSSTNEEEKISKLLHMNIWSEFFRHCFGGFDTTLGMKRGKFGTVEPPFLFLPPVQVVRYSDLLAVYRPGFTLPKELRLQAEALEKSVGVFKPVIDSLTCLEATLEELDDDRDQVVVLLIKHAHDLVKVRAELLLCDDQLQQCRFLPEQLRRQMEIIGIERDNPTYSKIEKKIRQLEVRIKAFGSPLSAMVFLYDNAKDLEDLEAEIDGMPTMQTKRRKPKRGKRVQSTVSSTPAIGGTQCSSPSQEDVQNEAGPAASDLIGGVYSPSESNLPNLPRKILSKNSSFETYLSDLELYNLLRCKMDVGTFQARQYNEPTFQELKMSIAYHVNKHAPYMLAEEYVSQGLGILQYWFGEIAERKVRGHGNRHSEGGDWVRIVRSKAGIGAFNLREDKVLWWQPPIEFPVYQAVWPQSFPSR